MTSGVSFQGLSTNLPTDQLISAVLSQESQPMYRLQDKQALNNTKTLAITTLKADLTSLSTSMSSLTSGGFQTRTVTSSDSTNTNVTATASGAVTGSYDVIVEKLATRNRLQVPTTAMTASDPIGVGDYTLTDSNGHSATITIDSSNNTLLGLRDAINNAKDGSTALNVSASVVQTTADGKSQLVISGKDTGKGTASASFTLSAASSNAANAAALIQPGTTLTSSAAENAKFNLNGVELERTSNAVSDAVDGVTFNLKAADTGKTTTLAVSLDKSAITSAMQSVISKYNTFYNDYKSKTSSTTNTDGTVTSGIFNNDSSIRNVVAQVHKALMGAPTNLASSATFNGASSIGLKTNRDGTLSLDTTAFQAALDKDADGVAKVFTNTGTSTSPLLSMVSATSATTSSPISFSLGTADSNGLVTGQFTTTPDGASSPVTYALTSSNGFFYGAAGTPLEGLTLSAKAGATGSLTVSKGVAQNLQDLVQTLTSSSAGNLGNILQNIATENSNLTNQIATQQERLDRRKINLKSLYANLETTVGQLQAAGQSISSM